MKKEDRKKICKELLILIGLSILLACWLIIVSQNRLAPFSEEVGRAVMSGKMQELKNALWDGFIGIAEFILFLYVPLLVSPGKKVGIKTFFMFLVFVVDAAIGWAVMVNGQVTWFYMLVLWLSSIYNIWHHDTLWRCK